MKVGVNLQTFIPSYNNHGNKLIGTLGVEKKIKNAFSFGLYGTYYQRPNLREININPEIKFYYKNNRNIKHGISANNFHGNYFLFRTEDLFKWENEYYFEFSNALIYKPTPGISAGWGMQRRIGNSAYIDFNTFLKFNLKSFCLGAKLSLGLGWGLKK